MKQTKRIAAACLSALAMLNLTACGVPEVPETAQGSAVSTEAATAMGRWVKSEPLDGVELGEGVSLFAQPSQLEDGTILAFGCNYDLVLQQGSIAPLVMVRSQDGGATWTVETTDWAEQVGCSIVQVAVRPDGTLLLQGMQPPEQEGGANRYSFWLRSPEGEISELPLAQAIQGLGSAQAWFMGDNTLVILPSLLDSITPPGDVCLYDLATNTVRDWATLTQEGDTSYSQGSQSASGERYVTSIILGGTAVGRDAEGNPVFYYLNNSGGRVDLNAMDEEGNIRCAAQGVCDSPYINAAVDAQNGYCLVDDSGIRHLAPGGSMPEVVVSGELVQTQSDNESILGICCTTAGDYLVAYLEYETEQVRLCRYSFDETLAAPGSGDALEVWSLYDNDTVRAAIAAYSEAQPEASVEYTPVLGEDSAVTREDAIRTLNTELLAGEGPDLMILDGTDLDSMAGSGLLADLGQMMDTGTLLPNIADDYVGETTMVLPARFSLPVLFGNQGSLDGLTTLQDLLDRILAAPPRPESDMEDEAYYQELPAEERYALSLLDISTLVDFTLATSASAILQDNTVNTDALRQCLDFIGQVGRYYGMDRYSDTHEVNGVLLSGGEGDAILWTDGSSEYNSCHRALYGWEEMINPNLLGTIGPDGKGDGQLILRPGLVSDAYTPSLFVAVNASTDKPDQAAALVQALFSDEIQGGNQNDGMPTTTGGMQQFIDRNAQALAEDGYTGDVNALIAQAQTPVVVDQTLAQTVEGHAEKLIDGEETLDQAVEGVSQDLALYLAERQ